jgi:hypothetical protein
MRAHQPGSTPIDIPETVPNPAHTPAPAPTPEQPPKRVPEKVPDPTQGRDFREPWQSISTAIGRACKWRRYDSGARPKGHLRAFSIPRLAHNGLVGKAPHELDKSVLSN